MDWFKKHADAVGVVVAIFVACVWMNGKFNEVNKEMSSLKMDIAVMKTVLLMKEILPKELVSNVDIYTKDS